MPPTFGEGIPFGHYTNAAGVKGITGVNPETIPVGGQVTVSKLGFGTGSNQFLANAPGDLFVASMEVSRHPNSIGVFGDKMNFLILFSQETAMAQGVRPMPSRPEIGIFTIPEGTTLKGVFIIKRLE